MRTGSFINGKWVRPGSDKTIKNVNPANIMDVISEFPAAGENDILDAVSAAQNAYKAWKDVPAPERGRYLLKVAEIAKREAENIAKVMTREQGSGAQKGERRIYQGTYRKSRTNKIRLRAGPRCHTRSVGR